MKTVQTTKGTQLPLLNLKGKDYLQVAYRIQWFTEEEKRFTVNSNFLVLTDDQTVCQVTISTFNEKGEVVRQAQGTKRETKKDFPDHTEKAETGAMGRALIELGYGTQFALADLDEGNRLADSPLPAIPKVATNGAQLLPVVVVETVNAINRPISNLQTPSAVTPSATVTDVQPLKTSSFRKPRKTPEAVTTPVVQTSTESSEAGW